MEQLKALGAWWRLFGAVAFILLGLGFLFGLAVPDVLEGILWVIAGILLFFAS